MRWNAPFMAVTAAIKRLRAEAVPDFRPLRGSHGPRGCLLDHRKQDNRVEASRSHVVGSRDRGPADESCTAFDGVELRSGARASQGNRHSRADLFWVGHLLRRWKIGERSFPARGRCPNAFAVCESSALRRSSPIQSLSKADRAALANANVGLQLDLMDDITTPCLVIVTPRGEFVTKRQGYQNPRDMAAFLKRAVAQARHRSSARGTNP